jgi:hypothetical protein
VVHAKVLRKLIRKFPYGILYSMAAGAIRPLCKATLQRMLTNLVYLGIIEYKGGTYEGRFPPIVSRATFEAVQLI